MRKKIIIALISIFVAVVIFAGGFLTGFNINYLQDWFYRITSNIGSTPETKEPASENSASLNSIVERIEETINYVAANALNSRTKEELATAAIEGILSSLDDRYSDYFTREEYSKIIESFSGTMSGIGVVITLDEEDKVVIINTIEGAPAAEKGVLKGDVITAVEETDISGMSLDEIVAMIKGKEGTDVKITVFRPSENRTIDFIITRKRFYIPNYYLDSPEEDILYIQYIDFQKDGAVKLNEKLKDIIDDGIKGIILDLRNNLGGTLDDAVDLSDLFLESGTIVTVKGRTDYRESYEEFQAKPGIYTDIPLVVLINGYSASAAELAAGALKELDRALLVGEKSFGKGTVQVLNDLSDGSGIKFTTAKYFLPSGNSIDGTGITPDITVELTPEDTEDLQLNRAIEELRKMIENN